MGLPRLRLAMTREKGAAMTGKRGLAMTPLLSLRGAPLFCSATLQGRAHEAKASHYISKHFCHCEER